MTCPTCFKDPEIVVECLIFPWFMFRTLGERPPPTCFKDTEIVVDCLLCDTLYFLGSLSGIVLPAIKPQRFMLSVFLGSLSGLWANALLSDKTLAEIVVECLIFPWFIVRTLGERPPTWRG